MGKLNNKDGEKKISFFKKYWGNIKMILNLLFFMLLCIFFYYLIDGLHKNLNNVYYTYYNLMFGLVFNLIKVIFPNTHILIEYTIDYFMIFFVFLYFIFKLKNKISKEGTIYRFLLDLVFIFTSLYVTLLITKILVSCTSDIYLVEYTKSLDKFSSEILLVILLYILNSLNKNVLLKFSSRILNILFFIVFLVGWITIKNFGLISLIVVVINQFMSYDDVLNVYSKLKIDYDNSTVDKEKINKQIAINKLYFNIFIVFLYIYIALTEDFKFFEFIYINIMSKGKDISKLLLIFYRGCNRIIIIEIIVIIYAIYLSFKKKSLQEELLKHKNDFESKLMKFMEKYIIRTK